jgi:hypothetical protein
MRDHSRLPIPDAALDVRIATSQRELNGAFGLLYNAYRDQGYIKAHPGRIVYDATFGYPSARTIIATDQADEVIGTLTAVGDNRLGLRLETTHPHEVQLLRDQGRNVAELTCLTIKSTGQFRPMAVFFALTEFAFHYAQWRGYDDLLMAIHPHHYRFYWRCFRADPLGPCCPNVSVRGKPSICCRIDVHHVKRNMSSALRRQYFSQVHPVTDFLRPPMDPADHRYFCTRAGIKSGAPLPVMDEWDQDAA